ncbi:hypothetical protein DTO021D3_2072 [Paecilomyces variotii]|nr:hypothetical protein DTO032I3_1820 [Paecilomyces variotii]KAJ9281018.1 hypothetical protein DTO021D3_2072 [Paecilomyces variotii]KAJ9345391.1 hypothetical protein DTO027B6_1922 [Paecilomyces variotii]KAJ9386121.1 hypothetical protein DTO032I4_3852 [Paecilomyces variotii]
MDPGEGSSDETSRNSRAFLLPGDPTSPRTSYLQTPRGSQSSHSNRRPSIRLRRVPSESSAHTISHVAPEIHVNGLEINDANTTNPNQAPDAIRYNDIRYNPYNPEASPIDEEDSWQGRRRSSSEPRPGRWSAPPQVVLQRLQTGDSQMRMFPLTEETSAASLVPSHVPEHLAPPPPAAGEGQDHRSMLRRASMAARSRLSGRNRVSTISGNHGTDQDQGARRNSALYDSRFVDFLDVVDPEVSTLSTLTNVQNSLFVPDLGRYINRMPTYTLSRSPTDESSSDESLDGPQKPQEDGLSPVDKDKDRETLERSLTAITSALSENETQFAVLPDNSDLEGWTVEDIRELNDHVRHMLHSRRSKFKRSMRGFGKYISKPLGFLVFLYATLITLFGLAWVLFLIGWINVGGRQLYVINVIDNVLVALFAIMGDGLAPFRAVDTYHMIFIAHYHHLTWKLRKKRALPKLQNKNDLPSLRETDIDLEDLRNERGDKKNLEFTVLSPLQQKRLMHHQAKFSKSHTFYKPHETVTHYAFPLRLLVAVVVLLDFHSIFQIALGTCTWSINYHVRPFALTTVILCCSITCNITAGVLIMVGDRMTRKKDVVERLFRQELTEEAMKKMVKRRRKEQRRNIELEVLQPYPGT